MPSIHYFDIDIKNSTPFLKLKQSHIVTTPFQSTIIPDVDNEVHTSIKNSGTSGNSDFNKYTVEHEEYKGVLGRYKNQPINYYISIEKLDFFKAKDENFIIVKASNQGALDSAVKKLSNFKLLKVKYYTLNLSNFLRNFPGIELTNAWKVNIKEKNLQSVAFYGPFILDSDLWIELENNGDISSIRIKVDFAGEPTSLTINKNGNISFHRLLEEKELLDKMIIIIDELKKFMVPSED